MFVLEGGNLHFLFNQWIATMASYTKSFFRSAPNHVEVRPVFLHSSCISKDRHNNLKMLINIDIKTRQSFSPSEGDNNHGCSGVYTVVHACSFCIKGTSLYPVSPVVYSLYHIFLIPLSYNLFFFLLT